MKLFKILLLVLPLLVAAFLFLDIPRNNGTGGGYYDLTNLYYAIFSGIYYFVFCIVMMVNLTREHKRLLVASIILFVAHAGYLLASMG
ncbi:hypothetical protein WJU16_09495 [Chitinophaga pollutisoli]|uniref:Uncharacterized protein n=1 Tax=Chitinophaga pollutisoli TaxID=3133966 RepID=A0ABZ2YX40_9BACT